ncbi:hypothetical protein C8Q76DRAFT_727544 [Earliella scabrosa]|nr:hypothetical protein C8Q76DRAFT_727544 [Earliella scabrosa]
MVRTQAKQTPDEKKEGKKKSSSAASSSSVKKKPDTGSWPCKMDGCKKVFAREADLKRHQRTTKTHSIPGFQCPQCDATFTRTDALRRHQKSRHNGVVIEPPEPDKDKNTADGASSGSRSPSPTGTPSRSQGESSMNGSPPAGSSERPASYYRPHTMQDGYYPGYPPPPRPPPGMMMDPHYPPPPMGLPTSATRGNWHPAPAPPPPWGPEGHPMPPPHPGMFMQSYYPAGYYRPPGVPLPPHLSQINPELLAQSNGHTNGVGPPESALRNTSAGTPPTTEGDDKDAKMSEATSSTSASNANSKHGSVAPRIPANAPSSTGEQSLDVGTQDGHQSSSSDQPEAGAGPNETAGADASALIAEAALQAMLAIQKEQEIREAAAAASQASTSTTPGVPTGTSPVQVQDIQAASSTTMDSRVEGAGSSSAVTDGLQSQLQEQQEGQQPIEHPAEARRPAHAPQDDDTLDLDAVGEPDQELIVEDLNILTAAATSHPSSADPSMPHSMDQLVTEDGTPMLNPEELLTQESLASPPPS